MAESEEKDSEVKEHYSKWMGNTDLTRKLKRRIEKVGYPLEAAARKILQNNGFYIEPDKYYAQLNEIEKKELWREIDIVAHYNILREEINGCDIWIDANIIADCKYSATNDFFAFELDETSFFKRFGEGLYWEFPIYLPKTRMVIYNAKKSFGSFMHFSSIVENIVEIDVGRLKIHPEGKTIYEASHQVINALAYFADKRMIELEDFLYEDEEERKKMSKVIRTYHSLNEELWKKKLQLGMKPEQATTETFKEIGNEIGKKLFPEIEHFKITLWIPMVILGRNNGIFRVLTTDDKVKDLEEIKFGIYRFTPSIIPDHFKKSVRATDAFPVVVCNLQYLNECIEFLKGRMSKVGNLIIETIAEDNEQLLEEFISYSKKYDKTNGQ